jgi:hypothetical protein
MSIPWRVVVAFLIPVSVVGLAAMAPSPTPAPDEPAAAAVTSPGRTGMTPELQAALSGEWWHLPSEEVRCRLGASSPLAMIQQAHAIGEVPEVRGPWDMLSWVEVTSGAGHVMFYRSEEACRQEAARLEAEMAITEEIATIIARPPTPPGEWWRIERGVASCVSGVSPAERAEHIRYRWGRAEYRQTGTDVWVVRSPYDHGDERLAAFWRSKEACDLQRVLLFPPLPASMR